MTHWNDDRREKLRRYLEATETRPLPTRVEVLGAFPELLPQIEPKAEKERHVREL